MSGPKRKILICGERVIEAYRLTFVLNTKYWCECRCSTSVNETEVLLGAHIFDAAVILGIAPHIHAIESTQSECKILFVRPPGRMLSHVCAEVVLDADYRTEEIVEILRVLCSRKRGPKPCRVLPNQAKVG